MAYPTHWLLQFGGTLGGGDGDIWTCGVRLGQYGEFGAEDMDEEQYLDDTAVPALSAWMMNLDANISVAAKLTFAKCNEIGPTGLYAHPQDVHERFFEGVSGSSGQPTHPYQVCLVYTWHCAEVVRGPGSTGRIYTPMPAIAIDSNTGLFNVNSSNAAARAARDLINSLDVQLGGPAGGVLRPSLVTQSGAGAMHQINRVSVDNRTDTQRRRANAMDPIRAYEDVNY